MTAAVDNIRNNHIRLWDGPSLSLTKNDIISGGFSSLNIKSEPEDVWNCYIPLTPPYSPVSFIPTDDTEEDFGCDRLQPVCLPPDDLLEETLDNIATYRDVNSVVIKDCMWGAQDVPTRTQQRKPVVSKLGEHPTGQRLTTETFDSTSSKIASVDPAEVFPPTLIADESLDLKEFSCSSDSDDDDSDIDVVTVEQQVKRKNVTTAMEIDSAVLASPPKTPDTITPTDEKKITTQRFLVLNLESLQPKDRELIKTANFEKDSLSMSAIEKFSRASHNVLERKRRNELKSKFYRLRDSIPEMSENRKVPKVAILKQAIGYVQSLKREEDLLLAENERQKRKSLELKNRIVAILRAGNIKK